MKEKKKQRLEANEKISDKTNSNNSKSVEKNLISEINIQKTEKMVVNFADVNNEGKLSTLEKVNEQNLKKKASNHEKKKAETSKRTLKLKKELELQTDFLREIRITIIDHETFDIFQNEFKTIKEAGMENINRDILIQGKIKIEKHKDSDVYLENVDAIVCYYSSKGKKHSICEDYKGYDDSIYK